MECPNEGDALISNEGGTKKWDVELFRPFISAVPLHGFITTAGRDFAGTVEAALMEVKRRTYKIQRHLDKNTALEGKGKREAEGRRHP